jgi:ferric-dicitrate binding protein FerR (iron transport regulator)
MRSLAEVEQAARSWLIRRNKPGFGDWVALDAWIREDPRHGRAYFRNIREDQRMIEEGDAKIDAGALPKVVYLRHPKAGMR